MGTSSSVERAFDLLDRIAAAGPRGLTLGELAADIPVAKSTTHRYVVTLLELGVLRRDDNERLHLGLKLVELASAQLDTDDFRSAAQPVLDELAARTQETVHLGLPTEGHIVYIAKVESPQAVRLVSRIGARVPMHCSAMGKALLARLDEKALADALQRPRQARTSHTITGEADLRRDLERVRTAGVAFDHEENELGVRCVAAAVLGIGSRPIGALSVSAPASRMSQERCAEMAPVVMSAAEEIARRLGRAPRDQNHVR